jgi:hypothetical protein
MRDALRLLQGSERTWVLFAGKGNAGRVPQQGE